jgi:predicted permease
VVVIGAAVWRARYAADPGLIGRTILVNGTPANVIGVLRDGFRFPINTDVWQPLGAIPGVTGQSRDTRSLSVIARLAPGASIESARAEVDGIGAVWRREFPETNRGIRATAIPINEQFSGDVTDRTWLSFITAGVLVLLVACANVANLLLMRGAARGREIAIRASMGAGRARLVRQLLIESAVLSLLGAVAGVLLSLAGLQLLSAMVPADTLFYWMTFTMDGRVLMMLVLASVASVFIFGLAPALHLLRVDVNQTIKESGRIGTVGVPARRWTASFLAVEFGLTLVLLALVFAGLRRGLADDQAEFPLDPAPVLSMWITLPGHLYESPELRVAFYDRLVERFAAIPGVSSVAVSSVMPRVSAPAMQLEIAGRPRSENDAAPMVALVGAGDGYFDTLGMPLVRGRAFAPPDGMSGQESAIVNQRFVDVFFGTNDPIGALIRVARPGTTVSGPWSRIVGVAPTIRQRPSGFYPDPVVYLPHRANPSSTAAILVHAGGPTALASAVRAALHQLDPNLPVYRLMTLDRAIDEAQWNGRMSGVMAQSIGLIALLMALVGLYAVTAHAVHFLRPELGLRIALGAQPRGVAAIVVRRTIRHLGLGLLVGLMCTYAFDRLFTAADDPSKLMDVRVLVPLVGLIAIVALAACAIPVRRAIRVDPVVALRAE